MSELSPEATPQRFIKIDEDGYFQIDGARVIEDDVARPWLKALRFDEQSALVTTTIERQSVLVEAFDAPFVVLSAEKLESSWQARMPYGHQESFDLDTLTLDEWDRFHGKTRSGVPFVFSRSAQAAFFDQLEEFDDDSITDAGTTYEMQPWLEATNDVAKSEFWNGQYLSNETPWDTRKDVYPALPGLVAQLKLLKSRVLVAGCGRGHDAAWFAQAGHLVTAIDYSAEAIKQAKELYGHIQGLTFVQADVFNLPQSYDKNFDVVLEHTLYCAIDPEKRNDLVKAWRRVLVDNGHLLGLFFASERADGPPYGGSEWELRSRLAKTFRPLYWQRLHNSAPKRLGTELFVYAQKLAALR